MPDFHAEAVRIWPFNCTSPHGGRHWDRALEVAYQPPAAADVFTEERGVSAVMTPGRAVMSRVVLGIAQQLVGAGRCSS